MAANISTDVTSVTLIDEGDSVDVRLSDSPYVLEVFGDGYVELWKSTGEKVAIVYLPGFDKDA